MRVEKLVPVDFWNHIFGPWMALLCPKSFFFAGIGKISYACLGGWWWVVDGGWWMKKCVLENLFLVQKHALRAPARGGGGGGAGLDDTDQRN